MTKEEFRNQIKNVISQDKIIERCEVVLNSGGIKAIEPLEDDDYSITNVILKVALESLANDIFLYSETSKKDYKNLKKFCI